MIGQISVNHLWVPLAFPSFDQASEDTAEDERWRSRCSAAAGRCSQNIPALVPHGNPRTDGLTHTHERNPINQGHLPRWALLLNLNSERCYMHDWPASTPLPRVWRNRFPGLENPLSAVTLINE
jgi:hypothetical protein